MAKTPTQRTSKLQAELISVSLQGRVVLFKA